MRAISAICVGLFVLLAFTSCKKDDNTSTTLVNKNLVLVKEIINMTYINNQLVPYDTIKYAYNSNQLLSEIYIHRSNSEADLCLQFNYANSLIISKSYNQQNNYFIKLNNNGTISNYSLFENTFSLSYNNEGYLIKAKGNDREGSSREFSFNYNNGNLISVYENLDNYVYTTSFEYTDTINKSNLQLPEEMCLPSSSYFPGMLGKVNKNLVKKVNTTSFEYELNSDTLITKVTRKGYDTIVSIIKY